MDAEALRQDDPTGAPPSTESEAVAAPVEQVQNRRTSRWRRRGDAERLQALTDAIAEYPTAPVNYVLRGELYLKHREFTLAALDFEYALAGAGQQLQEANWGLVAQTLQDRALAGLRQARQGMAG